jgi:hypothetical protein
MDKYGKRFIKASIIYLGLGLLLGMHMGFADHAIDKLRFIHVHLMLLGFMAMMIFGVAYHILPRFNAKAMPYPALVPIHFWLSNISLWGMLGLYAAGAFYADGLPRALFGVFGSLEATAIFMFIINIWSVVTDQSSATVSANTPPAAQSQNGPANGNAAPAPTTSEEKPSSTAGQPEILLKPSMKIAEILNKYPQLEERFIAEGLEDVVSLDVRNTVATIVTLDMAAKKANIDLYPLMARLEGKALVNADSDATAAPKAPANSAPAPINGDTITRGELAKSTTLIGSLLEIYPETSDVIEKNYGSACFTCPGQATETLEQTAGMHGGSMENLLDEINSVIKTVDA